LNRDPVSFLSEEMADLRENNLEWIIRYLDDASKPHSVVDGKKVLMLNTNNYLGLATHPKVVQASIEATKKYGAGAGAVPVIAGSFDLTQEFQDKFAKFKEVEASLLCQTGYAVN
jgi:glycine C-acetyltransferase